MKSPIRIPHSKPCLAEEEVEAASAVLRSGMLAQGREVAAFEAECAAFTGHRHGVAVNSGTAALHLALIALGVDEGHRVAMPAYACAALPQAVSWQRARPLPCDVDENYNLDPALVPADADAVIVVHCMGAQADAPRHARMIEDLAQSLGGPSIGATVAIASFYATKLCTTGEGGMVLTDDGGMAELLRDLRDYDNRDDFRVRYAYKMTDLQAAIGRVQLRRLPGFIARRKELAQRYTEAFSALPLRLPEGRDHIYFRYAPATPQREALAKHLAERGVDAKRPVYRPIHLDFGGVCPRADAAHDQVLSLPCYPALTDEESEYVIESVQSFFD
jgi:perosamine synthetase